MGADIYLNSKHQAAAEAARPAFELACARRDRFEPSDPQFAALHAEVGKAYDAMYAVGYFRDSYNATSLAYLLGFSWWRDVLPMVNGDGVMCVRNMKRLRDRLAFTCVSDEAFDAWWAKEAEKIEDAHDRDGWRAFFVGKRERLIALLDEAIALKEPLVMSL